MKGYDDINNSKGINFKASITYINVIVFLFAIDNLLRGLFSGYLNILFIVYLIGSAAMITSIFTNYKLLFPAGILLNLVVRLLMGVPDSIGDIFFQVALAFCVYMLMTHIDLVTYINQAYGSKKHPIIFALAIIITIGVIISDISSYSPAAIMPDINTVIYPLADSPFGPIITIVKSNQLFMVCLVLLGFFNFRAANTMIISLLYKLHVPMPKSVMQTAAASASLYDDYLHSGIPVVSFRGEYLGRNQWLVDHDSVQYGFVRDRRTLSGANHSMFILIFKFLFAYCYYIFLWMFSFVVLDVYFIMYLMQNRTHSKQAE
ncbi:hypothetical protein WR164_01570 [Philodulcilactobacillus myokoensis]|uniref:Uncharacterized protein n=1 Tax=Philodulcilactobacillus myokoensis TaxID=2929573 RepID=A0A9W6ESB8_9LACO|nr:hypothetical protein [Philodulcilactobacillus myokoensis]GLB46178.1 hypothetical protein WR164_01570 [Philodulcilactobacillus myokoensis]